MIEWGKKGSVMFMQNNADIKLRLQNEPKMKIYDENLIRLKRNLKYYEKKVMLLKYIRLNNSLIDVNLTLCYPASQSALFSRKNKKEKNREMKHLLSKKP